MVDGGVILWPYDRRIRYVLTLNACFSFGFIET